MTGRRVLLITAVYPPSRKIGGRRLHRFARGLTERGWQVTVLCMKPHLSGAVEPQPVVEDGVVVVETGAILPRLRCSSIVASNVSFSGLIFPLATSGILTYCSLYNMAA